MIQIDLFFWIFMMDDVFYAIGGQILKVIMWISADIWQRFSISLNQKLLHNLFIIIYGETYELIYNKDQAKQVCQEIAVLDVKEFEGCFNDLKKKS